MCEILSIQWGQLIFFVQEKVAAWCNEGHKGRLGSFICSVWLSMVPENFYDTSAMANLDFEPKDNFGGTMEERKKSFGKRHWLRFLVNVYWPSSIDGNGFEVLAHWSTCLRVPNPFVRSPIPLKLLLIENDFLDSVTKVRKAQWIIHRM